MSINELSNCPELNISVGSVKINSYGAVTQASSITTAVTLNAQCGLVTTVSSTLAALGNAAFTVNNSSVLSTSKVLLTLNGYSGTPQTNGMPYVYATAVTTGSFVVQLNNVHAANALSGTVTVAFLIA